MSGSAMRPDWLASMIEFLGMTVPWSRTCNHRAGRGGRARGRRRAFTFPGLMSQGEARDSLPRSEHPHARGWGGHSGRCRWGLPVSDQDGTALREGGREGGRRGRGAEKEEGDCKMGGRDAGGKRQREDGGGKGSRIRDSGGGRVLTRTGVPTVIPQARGNSITACRHRGHCQ